MLRVFHAYQGDINLRGTQSRLHKKLNIPINHTHEVWNFLGIREKPDPPQEILVRMLQSGDAPVDRIEW